MTTKEVIKSLPLEETLKMQMINMFDFLEPEQRLTIEVLVWDMYHILYKERLDENLRLQYEDVVNGNGKFGEDFYSKAIKTTEQDMQKDNSEGSTQFELSAARKAMEQIIHEIHAAKQKRKHIMK